jgi:hypothetical protein
MPGLTLCHSGPYATLISCFTVMPVKTGMQKAFKSWIPGRTGPACAGVARNDDQKFCRELLGHLTRVLKNELSVAPRV